MNYNYDDLSWMHGPAIRPASSRWKYIAGILAALAIVIGAIAGANMRGQ